ncbi:MAG: glycosyltransferase family 4 protein [Candidatus Aminicenantes bacterium]|nr:glycosyltransferase family 4 protein [Candidatus Aminicenantes bacterium]
MRIAIDLRPALKKGTGVGTYVQNLVENLALIDQENRYYLFSSSLRDRVPRERMSLPDNFFIKDYRIPVRVLNYMWHKYRFPPVDYLIGSVNISHSPHPLLMPAKKGKRIVTVHDLFFWTHPELTRGEIKRDYLTLAELHAHQADAIIAVSEHTKKDIIQFLKVPENKVRVIYEGVAESFRHRLSSQSLALLRKQFSLDSDYLLFVGTIEPRKNLVNLLRAFQGLVKRGFKGLKLVIVGERGWHTEEFDRELQSPALKGRVLITGYLHPEQLVGLYQAARMLTYPSLAEGFGLPLVEAMASGIPVVSSNTSCIPEIVGDAAILVDPQRPDEIEQAICSLLTDSELTEKLTRRGLERSHRFSWKETAEQTLQLYQQLAGEG